MTEQEQPSWAVVMTKPSAEEVAEKSIRQSGYCVYLPRYRKVLRGHRKVRGRGEVVLRPLFPGYLFVELHPGQSEHFMVRAIGVAEIMRYPTVGGMLGRPRLLAGVVVDEIRTAADGGVFDEARERKSRTDLHPGDQVMTPSGIVGELLSLDDKGRAWLLIRLLGHDKRVAVKDASSLEMYPLDKHTPHTPYARAAGMPAYNLAHPRVSIKIP